LAFGNKVISPWVEIKIKKTQTFLEKTPAPYHIPEGFVFIITVVITTDGGKVGFGKTKEYFLTCNHLRKNPSPCFALLN